MNENYIAVQVDDENNAELFWEALDERFPEMAKALREDGSAILPIPEFHKLIALPSWDDGPNYASTALLYGKSDTDVWANVVTGPHRVFEVLA